MNIDLTHYVIASGSFGPWLQDKDAFTANELRLSSATDGVTLAGPLRVCVAVQARNHFNVLGSAAVALQSRDVYSYTLDISPGQTWTYPAPSALSTSIGADATGALRNGGATASTAAAAAVNSAASVFNREMLSASNAGFGIAIRLAGPELYADSCAADPCRPGASYMPQKHGCQCGGRCGSGCGCGGRCGSGCSCGCHHETSGEELPCDFATGRGTSIGTFFPAACEPCAPGAFVSMPPTKGPSLVVPAARGGTVRTRYFNGMFITKEDLWTDQNNNRIKHALMNRAMGQGVVWGLDVRLDGQGVCVLPGYGVDCCGNDIVISSAYRVDAAALVRDPAAAALIGRGQQRLNLLLEYFECPEEPRPVHGDPCAPDTLSCEMSRIRETARLRLIPPCDVDDSGPIKDFLAEMQQLRGDRVVGPILTAPAPAPTAAPALQVPFTVLVEGLDGAPGVVGAVQLAPRLFTDTPNFIRGDALGVGDRSNMTRARITITAKAGFQLAAGNVTRTIPPGPIATPPTRTATSISWEDVLPDQFESELVFRFDNWRFVTTGGALEAPTTGIALKKQPSPPLRMKLNVDVGPSRVVASGSFPCSAEACDPEGRPRFPVPLPWLHEDPVRPGQAADPRVLLLAILYALVVSRTAQRGAALSADVRTEMDALAAALNVTAWRLFFDETAVNRQVDVREALRRLFQAWCKALLYPGPRCECGCDPHGVVIGCAVVEGGTLRSVDPWGGRRWVVHYPLLSYWGKQFGLQPFDAIASKFFDLLCCVAGLDPRPGAQPTGFLGAAPVPSVRTPAVSFGGSMLLMEQPATLPARLAELGLTATRAVQVTSTEFIGRVIEALNDPAAVAAPGASVVVFSVAGTPELNFVMPVAESAVTPEVSPPPPGPSRLGGLVQAAIAARPARSPVPLLLRDVAESVTRELLEAVVPEPASEAGGAVRDELGRAGITSVARLLDAGPEDLRVRVLNRANAEGLAELLESGEKQARSITKAVGDTLTKFAADGRIVTRDHLRDPQIARDFGDALREAVKDAAPGAEVDAAVARGAGR